MNLNRRLHECAQTLNDGNLLAKLGAGDAIAQELKYHLDASLAYITGRGPILEILRKYILTVKKQMYIHWFFQSW